MQSRRGGGPHPPAVNLRPDQRADVGIGPYVVQEAERYPQDCRGGSCPRPRVGAGDHKGRPYIWRERYQCRTVGAGLVPARVSLAPAAEEKEDAHAGGVRVLLV